MDFVQKVKEFNKIAGTDTDKFDKRNTALYIGLQLEEMAEKIDAILEGTPSIQMLLLKKILETYSEEFKEGDFDHLMTHIDRTKALDADIDLAVVALGGAIAIGADVECACHCVADNNLSKFPQIDTGERIVIKDDNGKIRKPENYTPPDLSKYLR